jgi:hypothetical protein
MNTKQPFKKIQRIQSFLSKDLSQKTVDEVKEEVEKNFNVGVFVLYGRLKAQTHTFEIYRKYKGEWKDLLCLIEIPFDSFKSETDY